MIKQLVNSFLLILTVSVLSGCYTTEDGQMKATINPWGKDDIVARYERPLDQIFEAGKEVLTYNGSLISEDRIGNTLRASIDDRTVWVKVEQIEESLTEVTVQARSKWGRPDVELASEIDKQIALRLR
jgi:hypothetical protein